MNANKEVMRFILDDYRRLERIASHQAYENCDHRNKIIEKCARKQECYEQWLVNYFLSELVRGN